MLGDRAGEMVVLAYQLLKHTGRRLGEVASLHLDCLDVDENAKAVLVYDNHKAGRMGRRLPVTDTEVVRAVRASNSTGSQSGSPTSPAVACGFSQDRPATPPAPPTSAPASCTTGCGRGWRQSPASTLAPPTSTASRSRSPRSAITPHAFRHTYAQTLADQGVPAPVLRDLMDHHHMNTTLGLLPGRRNQKT